MLNFYYTTAPQRDMWVTDSLGHGVRMMDELLINGFDLGSCTVEDYVDEGPLRKWKVTCNEPHRMDVLCSYPIISIGERKVQLRKYLDKKSFIVQSVKGSNLVPGSYTAHADGLGWSKVYENEEKTIATYKSACEEINIYVKITATDANGSFDQHIYIGDNFDPTTGQTSTLLYNRNWEAGKWWGICFGNNEGFAYFGYNGQNFHVLPVRDPINKRIGVQMSNSYTYGTWGNVNTSLSWWLENPEDVQPFVVTNNFIYPLFVVQNYERMLVDLEHPIEGEEFAFAYYRTGSDLNRVRGTCVLGNHSFLEKYAYQDEYEYPHIFYPRKLKAKRKFFYEIDARKWIELPQHNYPQNLDRWDDLGIIEGYIQEEGNPLQGIEVQLIKEEPNVIQKSQNTRRVWTNENGYYKFWDLDAHSFYSVIAKYPNDIHNDVIKSKVRPESYFNIERNASREIPDDNQSP